jgi:8-oxo-dGTP pyrophosphatase MutT (NUDIX family)
MSERKPPSVTVAAVIERDGRFLLVEEHIAGKRVYNQPAGHLDPGESLVQACEREVLEETAYHFVPRALVGIYRWHYAAKDVTFLRFAFCGDIEGHEPGRALDHPVIAVHWLTRTEIAERTAAHRSPLVARCVEDYLGGRRFPLEVLSKEFA